MTSGVPWDSTWSAKALLDCFNPDDRNKVSSHAHSIKVPTNFIFGKLETTIGSRQESAVCRLARRVLENSVTDGPEGIFIDVIEGANHSYAGKQNDLSETTINFLKTC